MSSHSDLKASTPSTSIHTANRIWALLSSVTWPDITAMPTMSIRNPSFVKPTPVSETSKSARLPMSISIAPSSMNMMPIINATDRKAALALATQNIPTPVIATLAIINSVLIVPSFKIGIYTIMPRAAFQGCANQKVPEGIARRHLRNLIQDSITGCSLRGTLSC